MLSRLTWNKLCLMLSRLIRNKLCVMLSRLTRNKLCVMLRTSLRLLKCHIFVSSSFSYRLQNCNSMDGICDQDLVDIFVTGCISSLCWSEFHYLILGQVARTVHKVSLLRSDPDIHTARTSIYVVMKGRPAGLVTCRLYINRAQTFNRRSNNTQHA